jgi:histidinol-phosphate aminotransferase
MTPQLRAALESLPLYVPGRSVPGAIKLASNEIPFPPMPQVVAAITEAAAASTRYPDLAAVQLTERLAQLVDVDPARVVVGCGSVALCQQLIEACCEAGDEVLYPWRSFEAYPIATQVVGATSVHVPLSDEAFDLEALTAAVTPRTRVIFVCTPNNPTGTIVTKAELDRFLEGVPDDVLVVVDEAYREFVTDPDAADGLAVADRENVVVLRTLSKAYGLAGLRVGYAVAQPVVAAALRKVAIPFAVNSLAQAAALAALGQPAQVRERCATVVEERRRVREELLALGYVIPPTEANFVWLPLRDRSAEFAAHCEQRKVIVRPFNHPETGGVRVTIGTAEQNAVFLEAARTFDLSVAVGR